MAPGSEYSEDFEADTYASDFEPESPPRDEEEYSEDFDSDDEAQPQHPGTQPKEQAAVAGAALPNASPSRRPLTDGWRPPSALVHAPPKGSAGAMAAPPLALGTVAGSAPPAPARQLTAEQQERAAHKLRRALALQQHVSLTQQAMPDLLSLPAASPYQLMTRGQGPFAAKRTAATQTRVAGVDVQEGDAQTDDVEVRDTACQVPEARTIGHHQAPSSSSEQGAAACSRDSAACGSNARHLADFLDWACDAVEDQMACTPSQAAAPAAGPAAQLLPAQGPGQAALSAGSCALTHPQLLAGRRVVAMAVTRAGGPGDRVLLCCAYAPAASSGMGGGASCPGPDAEAAQAGRDLASLGCLCVWDPLAPAAPLHVLLSEGVPSCCSWGAGGCRDCVIAGMEEGGVCGWDTSEPSSSHSHQEQLGSSCPPARWPSYSTEAHVLSLPRVEPVAALAVTISGGNGAGASCQVIALSCEGMVSVYSLRRLSTAQAAAAAAEADMGMRPGSALRMVLSHTGVPLGRAAGQQLQTGLTAAAATGPPTGMPLCASSMTVLPGAPPQLLVGSCTGMVLRGACVGVPGVPREYAPHAWRQPLSPLASNTSAAAPGAGWAAKLGPGAVAMAGAITALAVCPDCPEAFLAAHACGTLTLHISSKALAALAWPALVASGLVAVSWCPTRPCVFLALSSAGELWAFDLAASTLGPVAVQAAAATRTRDPSSSGCACSLQFVPSPPPAANGSQPGPGSAPALQQAVYALGFTDGSVQCHALPPGLAQPRPGELDTLRQLLL